MTFLTGPRRWSQYVCGRVTDGTCLNQTLARERSNKALLSFSHTHTHTHTQSRYLLGPFILIFVWMKAARAVKALALAGEAEKYCANVLLLLYFSFYLGPGFNMCLALRFYVKRNKRQVERTQRSSELYEWELPKSTMEHNGTRS